MSEEKRPPKSEHDLLLDHNYDGIQELDHPLPRWWVWLFYATIVFAVFYAGYYMLGSGPTARQELAIAMKEIDSLRPAAVAPTGEDSEMLQAALKDPTKLKHGFEVYVAKCQVCHGDKGQGIIGPNLTDDYWIHGKGAIQDIEAVVESGVADKGMPPWGQILTPEDLHSVVAFVYSLHGSNPPGAKPPQGERHDGNQ